MRDDPDDYGERPSPVSAAVVGMLVFVVGIITRVRGWLKRLGRERRAGEIDDHSAD